MTGKDWMFGFKQGIEIHKNYLPNYRMAIVNLHPGENSDAAWRRHLVQNPEDIAATIRVFNRFPIYEETN
jgi:hypothetical protein